jgi:hypothetical protein
MLRTIVAIVSVLVVGVQAPSRPDGKLAYILNGDVWIKTLPDGAPHQVSQGGEALHPLWSASGHWLTFQQKKKVVAISHNGERREITADHIAWSPQSDELAFIDQDGLSVVGFDGSEPRKRVVLRNSPAFRISDLAWNQDGTKFAVSVVTPDPAGRPEFRVGHLWLVNIDGTQSHEIFTPKERGGVEPIGWSSDGQSILAQVDHDFSASLAADGLPLISVPALGGPPRELAANVLVPSDFVSVSGRKREVLVVNGGGRDTWTDKRLTLIDPATGRLTELTDDKTVALSASWSPDGSQIAYVAGPDNKESQKLVVVTGVAPNGRTFSGPTKDGGDPPKTTVGQRRIWIIGADGNQHQLTSDSRYRDEYPLWSGDGRSLLFIRMDQQDNASVWSVDVENGTPLKIIEHIDGWFGYYGHVDWSAYLGWHRN